MAQLNFDPTKYEADQGYGEPIPEGWYLAIIDESEVKPTKDNAATGNLRLNLRFSILDEKYKNRKVFNGYNIKHVKKDTEEIALKQLTGVCHALGLLHLVQDSQEMHNIPLKVKVKLVPASPKEDGNGVYPPKNEISAVRNQNDAQELGPTAVANSVAANGAVPKNPFAANAAPAVSTPAFLNGGAAATPVAAPVAAPAPAPVAAPAAPAVPAVPAAPVAPPAPPVFPPAGWIAHPEAAGYYYCGQEVLTEADLRARFAPAAPVAAPVAPPSFPMAPAAAPVAAPAVAAQPATPNPAAAQAATPPWAR